MKRLISATIAGAVAVNVSVIVVAQTSWGPEAYHGNVGRGTKIAAWGTSKGVASCSSCHGYDGVGNGDSRVPRLAGQSSAYLAQQLNDYASGKRNNIVMANFAQATQRAGAGGRSCLLRIAEVQLPAPAKRVRPACAAAREAVGQLRGRQAYSPVVQQLSWAAGRRRVS